MDILDHKTKEMQDYGLNNETVLLHKAMVLTS